MNAKPVSLHPVNFDEAIKALCITPEVREDHADYIGHWLKVLAEDKHAVFQAAAHAQRAADYLQGLQSSSPLGSGAIL